SERGTRILCDTLVTTGLLQKADGAYSNAPDSAIFLNRTSPAYMGGVTEFLSMPEMMHSVMDTMADCVRKGGTTLPGDGTVDPDNPIWVRFAEVMAPIMVPGAMAIAAQVPETGPVKVLDIAAGHGLFGITIAKRNAQAQIVALDWRAVLEVARKNAAAAGVIDRYQTIAGSAFEVEFGEGYDFVLVTNFLHHFGAKKNEELLRKVYAALKPGGHAITLEFVPDETRVAPVPAARFAMTMLTGTHEGDAYTFDELAAMAQNAGFVASRHVPLEAGQSVIISTK
ncbi:MAG: Methyltransferase type 12, partial [Bryobacterales bacterium]|nr:Methyltransferase type 12 [Bryobacterales bacterium]